MREGAAAVAVAERPNRRDTGAQEIVGSNKAALVDCDAGRLETEIVRVRHAPDGEQEVRARNLGFPLRRFEARADVTAGPFKALARGASANVDALAGENVHDGGGHVLVLARHETRGRLDDRDLGSEAAENLGELEPDVAAAEHDEAARYGLEVHDRLICQVIDRFEAGDRRNNRPSTDVDVNPLCGKPLGPDLELGR